MTRIPLHPLLVALVPVLSMYATLPGRTDPAEAFRSCLVALAFAALVMAAAGLVYRDLRKGALAVSAALVVYIVVGSTYESIQEWQVAGVYFMRRRYFLPVVYAALAFMAVAIFRTKRPLGTVTGLANILALGAILPPVVALANVQISAARQGVEMPVLEPIAVADAPREQPDIYYIVFDRYGGRDTLRARGIDNDPAYRYLEDKGFYVAGQSRSNYIKTVLSLAASLNLDYLDDLPRAYGTDSGNWAPIYDRVKNNRVSTFLRGRGYDIYHLGSWYWPTRDNPQAAHNINYYDAVPLATKKLLDSNVLFEPVLHAVDSPLINHRRQQWHRVTRQVDNVIALAERAGPKFVFLHVLVPHPPYVFDRDGSYVPIEVEHRRTDDENYVNQVHAANSMMRRLVDGILARSPAPPVILIQGDEGPYPVGTESDFYDWTRASADTLRERAGILNAYLFPGGRRDALYPDISPVNSFRVVFNEFLGTRLPLLPDRTMRHESGIHPLAFDDVSTVVRRADGASSAARAASAAAGTP